MFCGAAVTAAVEGGLGGVADKVSVTFRPDPHQAPDGAEQIQPMSGWCQASSVQPVSEEQPGVVHTTQQWRPAWATSETLSQDLRSEHDGFAYHTWKDETGELP